MGLGKILDRIRPDKILERAVDEKFKQTLEDGTKVVIMTGLQTLGAALPEITAFAGGNKVRLAYKVSGEIELQLKQEGEP